MKATEKSRGGRPSREGAEKLGEKILAIATELMLSQGYGATSIEQIAKVAGISKRTFYHRFKDKADLMTAVITALVNRLRPTPEILSFSGKPLDVTLEQIAGALLHAVTTPEAIQMHRLIVAEIARFPDLAEVVEHAGGKREAEKLIAELLQTASAGKKRNPIFEARQFMQMVIAEPRLRALGIGAPMSAKELKAWAKETVRLFLKGFEGA